MLTLENISFHVEDDDKRLEIVDDVSLTLEDGKILVITGPNGGGKSTLARLIMGIETPTSGRILFNGEDITGLSISERAKRGIGYAFQQPPRFKGLTVRELLTLAHGGSEMEEHDCCALLSKVGLCARDYIDRAVDASLSGGEVKRIEIATLMARNLKLAIYDEPEAGIDLWSFSKLVESFRTISRQHNESVVLISHQERIMQLADEMIIISGGKIREQGSREEIFPRLFGEIEPPCCMANGGNCNE